MSKVETDQERYCKIEDGFDVSEKNVFKKDPLFFCFSKSCLHGLSDVFYVLANIVVLYYGINRYSCVWESG